MTPVSAPSANEADDLKLADELNWEAVTGEALVAFEQNRLSEAVLLWRMAAKSATGFAAGDPRLAATANNLGCAHLLDEHTEAAAKEFNAAGQAWAATRTWVKAMAVPQTARSSLFHLRLELKHRDAFAGHLRTRFEHLVDGGEAATLICQATLAFAELDFHKSGALFDRARTQRRRALNADVPEIRQIQNMCRLIAKALGEAPKSDEGLGVNPGTKTWPQVALESWRDDRPHEMNDARRVLAAVYLSAMILPE
ncbi:hypothetical protein MNBD_ALPHA04-599 [hydrothermal vent metagenome]|uniref:Uncharacterized protein n=1 Tax=hydrothermal vent metagenome TaxID=652676 RepID=A0A3B0SGA7_9ZZZZ